MARAELHIPPGRRGRVELVRSGRMLPWQGPPHHHRELELNIVVHGRATYIVGGDRCPLHAGSLLWLFEDQPHLLLDYTAQFEMWVAVFRKGFVRRQATGELAKLAAGRRAAHLCRVLPPDRCAALAAQARLLDDASMPGDHHTLGMAWLLGEAWRQCDQAPTDPEVLQLHPVVARAARRLRDDPDVERLGGLAAELGIDLPQLSRLFRAQVGQTLTEFRSRQRLARFADLLAANARVNLLAAALEAGFQSYAQCFRDCRQHLGVSPSQLRARGG